MVAASPDTKRISIHAPREGCDADTIAPKSMIRDFNPRTP